MAESRLPVLALFAVGLMAGLAAGQPGGVQAFAMDTPGGSGAFLENRGQWRTGAAFVARRGSLRVGVEGAALLLAGTARPEATEGRGHVVRFAFGGADDAAVPVGVDERPERYHFLIGTDPAGWRTDVRAYDALELTQVHAGTDLKLRFDGAAPSYTWHVAPGCSPAPLRVRCDGIEALSVADDGSLRLATPLGDVLHLSPRGWEQLSDGQRREVTCSFRLLGPRSFGYEVVGRDPSRPLLISSGLEWSTFLGSDSDAEGISCLGLTADGGVSFAGVASSNDFPTTPGAFDTTYGGGNGFSASDVFVAHLDPSGSELEWATFLGGSNNEQAEALLVDRDDGVVVAGRTGSADFPTTPGAYAEVAFGLSDAYVTKLTADGSALDFSTFLGGAASDEIWSLTRDAQGTLVAVGFTQSVDFPVTADAFQPELVGAPQDAFCARLSGDGSALIYATFLGGTEGDTGVAVATDGSGRIYIAGTTRSTDFPVTPDAYNTEFTEFLGSDVFVSCFDASGGLVASTYLGGDAWDVATWIGVDPTGRVVVTGWTEGADAPLNLVAFPTTSDAFDATFNPFEDVFVSKFDPNLQSLVYSTFVGGSGRDFAEAMVVEPSGAVVVAGDTTSSGFPVTAGCFQPDKAGAGETDMFVFRLSPAGDALHYSTYLGGSDTDSVTKLGLAVDAAGAVTLGATSVSDDFPTTPDSYDPRKPPDTPSQAIIARLTMLPTGTAAYGTSTAGCNGPLTIGVTSMPQVGNEDFALTCANAPPAGPGILALAPAGLSVPVPLRGAHAWIDLSAPLVLVPVHAGRWGYVEVPLALPVPEPTLAGHHAFAQFFFSNDGSPGDLAASNALAIAVQAE